MQISVANVQIVYQLMPPGICSGLDSWRFAGYVCLCAWAVTEIMEGRVCGGCEFQFVMKPPQNGALGFVVATIKQSSWTIQLIYAGNLMELCCFWVVLSKIGQASFVTWQVGKDIKNLSTDFAYRVGLPSVNFHMICPSRTPLATCIRPRSWIPERITMLFIIGIIAACDRSVQLENLSIFE